MGLFNMIDVRGRALIRGKLFINRELNLKSLSGDKDYDIYTTSNNFVVRSETGTWVLSANDKSGFNYMGHKVWHANNDGSGSGLDADTLDGNHASAFLKLTGGSLTGTLLGVKGLFNTMAANEGLGVDQTTGTGAGLSLYGSDGVVGTNPSYGLMFALTSNFIKHGAVQGDWATYFNMAGADNRGWIFKNGTSGVGAASISMTGIVNAKTYTSNADVGQYILSHGSATGIYRMTDQGGLTFHCDSSMLLFAGDTPSKITTGYGITSAFSTENLYLAADGEVILRSRNQDGFASGKEAKLDLTGNFIATAFKGNGAQITHLNASSIATGTIHSDRLPTATSSIKGAVLLGTAHTSAARGDHGHTNITTNTTADWNDRTMKSGFYQGNAAANSPESAGWFWGYRVQHADGYGAQIAVKNGGDRMYYRSQGSDGSGTWRRVFHTGNAPTWAEVTGKPTTMPPSAHTHMYCSYSSSTSSTDLNDINGFGIMQTHSNVNATVANHYPESGSSGMLIYGDAAYNSSCQIYHTYASNKLFIRGGGSGTEAKTSWTEVWTKLNAPFLNYASTGGTGGRPTGTTRLNLNGYLYTNRVYGAVWNDYAEYFEKGDDIQPGDVVELLDGEEEIYVKAKHAYSPNVVGVCSDEYGQCLGGRGDGKDEENFTPIGLAGRVKVKLVGKAKKGDLLTSSDIPGVAMVIDRTKDFHGTVIGKCLENKLTDEIKRTRMIIQLG